MLSIIIPTLNEEKWLPFLLVSIKHQDFADYEIIIADSGSSDSTLAIEKRYGCTIVPGCCPGTGINRVAKYAKVEYRLFPDADFIFPDIFLSTILRETTEHISDIATCPICPLSQKNIGHMLHNAANYYILFTRKINPHPPGFCILAKKSIQEQMGGFNENLKLADDHEYIKRLSKFGKFKILSSQRILVSVRRLEKEGRIKLTMKYIFVDLHRIVKGEIYSHIIDYQLGHDYYPDKNVYSL